MKIRNNIIFLVQDSYFPTGVEEGEHRAEEEDHGAHEDGAPGAGDGEAGALPGHHALRLPDPGQAPPRAGLRERGGAVHTPVPKREIQRIRS